MANDTVYVAISTGSAMVQGKKIEFTKDKTFLRADHPLLAACPTYFVVLADLLTWPPKQ